MKVTKTLLIFLLPFIFSFSSLGLDESAREYLEAIEKRFLEKKGQFQKNWGTQSDFFDKLEEKFDSVFDRFGKTFFDDFFEDDFFKDFDFGRPKTMKSLGRWKELKSSMVFILDAKTSSNTPLDIKIKDGQIFISGEFIEQSKKGSVTTQRSFRMRQSYSIPEGVDTDNPKISKNNGEIKIIFKKLNNFKRKTRPLRRTVPIKPSPMDKTI